MTSVGRASRWITLAIVNVLPEPVTPMSTWARLPARRPSQRASTAWGWSPANPKGLSSWNTGVSAVVELYNRPG